MIITNFESAQGHWILAKMGKRVLRPGGKELTLQLIDALNVSDKDDVVEFAPGIGYTASIVIGKKPRSYIGVDAEADIVADLKEKINGNQVIENISFLHANAAQTNLMAESKNKVYGEAMLTMQSEPRKTEIVKEAYRILQKGGLYAIHEIALEPVSLTTEEKNSMLKDLAQTIKVNARPLTTGEWRELLEKEGFKIKKVVHNDMLLLEIKRLIDDEGFFRFLKIVCNVLTHPQARKRIIKMRKAFKKHQKNMKAILIVAEK